MGVRGRVTRQREFHYPEISSLIRPAVWLQSKKTRGNSTNQRGKSDLTLDQLSAKLVGIGLVTGSCKLQRCLQAEGATKVKRCVIPILSWTHKKNRVDFVFDRTSKNHKTFPSVRNTAPVDKPWFYLIRERKLHG